MGVYYPCSTAEESCISRNSINHLPPELLLCIFEEVYLASCDLEFDAYNDLVADPRLFPHCITKVCKAWKRLVKSVPHFSTHVMAFVDEPIPLVDLRAEFKISRSLLIKVFVVRKDYKATEDSLEKRRVKEVMEILVPHITRCQVVVFDLLHDSSLPRITYFSGRAAKLRTLRMKCRLFGSAIPDIIPPTPSLVPDPKAFLCPRLQYLDLDGRVFIAALRIPGWAESIRMLTRKQLSITNMTRSEDQEFNLHDLLMALEKMGHVKTLKLSNVDLDPHSCIGRAPVSIFIQNFEFAGLKSDFLAGFFNHHSNRIDISNIILDQCELGPPEYLNSRTLYLQGIRQEEDITGFVKHWDGFGLHVADCPGLDDGLLTMLSNFRPSKDTFFAPRLRELAISSSGSISVKAVKELVFIRKLEYEMRDLDWEDDWLPIWSVSVMYTDVVLSLEDRKWLRDRLEFLTWYTNPPVTVCESPILEGDCAHWDFSLFDDFELDKMGLAPSQQTRQTQQESPPDSPIIPGDYSLIEWSVKDLQELEPHALSC